MYARALAVLLLILAGCATPSSQFHHAAARDGLTSHVTQTATWPLTVFEKNTQRTTGPVHVYLDGDGRPGSRTAGHRDPTTRERLVLRLLDQDPATALLIGRPCYYIEHVRCEPDVYTEARYGEAVVAALAQAIETEIARFPARPLTLIGYSGGGALAMLLAARLPRVDHLITIAANLDTTAWAAHHGQRPLLRSLNPAAQPPLAARIGQLHLFGGRDDNVPAALMRPVADAQPHAQVRIIDDYTHRCCWADQWGKILHDYRAAD